MSCLSNYTLNGIASSCEPNLAGIKKAYLGYADEFNVTISGDSAHSVTIASAESATNAHFYEYEFNRQTGSLTSTLTKDEANGTRYYTNAVVLQFTKMEQQKHLEVEAMAAEHLIGVIEDNNGKYWLVGGDGYLSMAEGTAQSGQSYDDLNGYNLTLNAMSAYLPFEIEKADFEDFIAD